MQILNWEHKIGNIKKLLDILEKKKNDINRKNSNFKELSKMADITLIFFRILW